MVMYRWFNINDLGTDEQEVTSVSGRAWHTNDSGVEPILGKDDIVCWLAGMEPNKELAHCVRIDRPYRSWNSIAGWNWIYEGTYLLDNGYASTGDFVYFIL